MKFKLKLPTFIKRYKKLRKKNFVVKLKSKNLIINEIGPEMLQSLKKIIKC